MRTRAEGLCSAAQRNEQPQAGGESPERSETNPSVPVIFDCSVRLLVWTRSVLQTMDDRTESAVFLVETQRMRCIVKCT